jgi:hypothetical protein
MRNYRREPSEKYGDEIGGKAIAEKASSQKGAAGRDL